MMNRDKCLCFPSTNYPCSECRSKVMIFTTDNRATPRRIDMMKKKLVVLLAMMAMLLVAFAAPVLADNDRHEVNRFDVRYNNDHEFCWWEWSDIFEEWKCD